MKVWLMPIEPLVERYSADWLRWWPADLRASGVEVEVVEGVQSRGDIGVGQFLDAVDTMRYKATQVDKLLASISRIEPDDVVLFLDGWNPAVEMLAYARQLTGRTFRIECLMHAGTWDAWDHITQRGLRSWAKQSELSWFRIYDAVYVATQFHRQLIHYYVNDAAISNKLVVHPFPLKASELAQYRLPWNQRARRVVFPHRIAPEKVPHAWDDIVREYRRVYGDSDAEFIRTKDVARTKAEYYALLGSSKCAVSTARQETWGIAMLESLACGARPVAPTRLSYPETMQGFKLYTSISDAVSCVRAALDEDCAPSDATLGVWESAIYKFATMLLARSRKC